MAVALFYFISLVQVLQGRFCDVDTSNSEGKSRVGEPMKYLARLTQDVYLSYSLAFGIIQLFKMLICRKSK